MKITLKEVAELAGVHRSTVDKVIHNRVGVSDAVRQRVKNILREVGYQPNELGQALRRRQEKYRIAVLLLRFDALEDIQRGVEKALEQYSNFHIEMEYHISAFRAAEEQAATLKMFVDQGVDGIIISPVLSDILREALSYAAEKKIPVITTNMDIEKSERLCFVGQNGQQAGRIAARIMGEFLGGQGIVAIIASVKRSRHTFTQGDREQSFLQHLAQEFPKIDVLDPIHAYDDPKVILQETMALLHARDDINGLYVTGGGVPAVGKAIKLSGYQDKRPLKVICYEQYPSIKKLMQQDIITCSIASGLEQQGYEPVRLLMELFVNAKKPTQSHYFTESVVLFKENLMV